MLARLRPATEEHDEGFTLIELLVVMIIIGILAAIAIPVFLNQRQKAVDSAMKSDLRTVANAAETHFTDNQTYAALHDADVTTGPLGVALSDGNTVTVEAYADTFCLVAGRAADTSSSTQDWVYDSAAGGLQPLGVETC